MSRFRLIVTSCILCGWFSRLYYLGQLREIGIRFAVGASRRRLLWLMFVYVLKLVVPGLAIIAALGPALRATKVDLTVVLRQ